MELGICPILGRVPPAEGRLAEFSPPDRRSELTIRTVRGSCGEGKLSVARWSPGSVPSFWKAAKPYVTALISAAKLVIPLIPFI